MANHVTFQALQSGEPIPVRNLFLCFRIYVSVSISIISICLYLYLYVCVYIYIISISCLHLSLSLYPIGHASLLIHIDHILLIRSSISGQLGLLPPFSLMVL